MAYNSFNRIVDGIAVGSLLVALLLVYVVDRPTAAPLASNDLKVQIISSPKEPTSKLRLGVTPTQRGIGASGKLEPYDDMGKLLDELGKGFAHEVVTTEELLKDPAKIKSFDVLFLTCH